MTLEDDGVKAVRPLLAGIETGDEATLRQIYAENSVKLNRLAS
jgi:hypothetical protein